MTWTGTAAFERARRRYEAIFAGHPGISRAWPVFYVQEQQTDARLRHWRRTCCLNYKLPGEEMCEGECPLLPAGREALRMGGES